MLPVRKRCISVAVLLPAFALAGRAQSQEPKLPDKALKAIRQQIAFDDHLPGEKNPAGLHLEFSKIGENNVPQGHVVAYRVYAAGADEKKKYVKAIWRIGSQPQFLPDDVYVNARGLLMANMPRPDQETKDSVDSDNEDDIAIQAALGEPIRFFLATPDGKLAIPGTVVPYPIESEDKGCHLEARLAMPQAAAVVLYVDGLQPNTDIPFQSVAEGESHSGNFHTNASGHGAAIILPGVIGKSSGMLKVTVTTKECIVSVEVPWGNGTNHPM